MQLEQDPSIHQTLGGNWRQQRQTLIGPHLPGHKHIVSDIIARLTVNGRVTSCICEDLEKWYETSMHTIMQCNARES